MSAVGGVGGYQAAKQRMLVKEFAQKAGMSEQEVTAAVRDGRIRELASFAEDKAEAKRQAEKFVGSVQKSIKGETSSSDILIVNEKTPRILQKYGAENRALTMSQSVMRKIAYPEGYMGGKHNLGFVALAKLPEQLADPMAVLKSASQKNSLVIITELVDTENRPVIVPIHLDKSGRIGLTNEVPSMYSKDGFSNFVKAQEKAGNILYTKKDRVLDDIPVNGLQLSEMGNQADPIFNNSISQGVVNMQELSGKSLENYRRMSSFAEAKGGRIVVRNDMEAGNPGYVLKNNDGSFEIVVSDEALIDYVVMGHEITHVLEGTEEYGEYADFIQRELESRGVDIAAVKKAVSDVYAEHGRNLSEYEAAKETVAMYTAKHLFDDQVVINRLAKEKPNLFQRIWEWIQDTIAKLRGRDSAFYIETRKRFVAAYRSAGGAHEGRFDSGRQDMFVGVDPKTGLRVYKSDFPESVPFAERKKIFKERIATIFNLGRVHLSTNSRKIIVNGDKFTRSKNIFGDNKSTKLGYKTKINALYDLVDILENAKYIGSGKEPSFDSDVISKNKAHENVKYWHYFESHIIFDGVPVDVLFNIRDKGNEQFQYLIEIKEKQSSTPSHTAAKTQPRAFVELNSVNDSIQQSSPKNNGKTLENIDKKRQNSVEFDIDRIISLNQRGARRAWSDSVKEFDKVKKNVKTGGKQGKSLYEGLFEVLGKKGQQTEVLQGSLADVLGIETESGRKVAASLEEKIGKKRIISQKDRLAYFENLFDEYQRSHGNTNLLERTRLWQFFTTYLDDLQEANGLRRNMPRMKDIPRFEIGGKKKSAAKTQSAVKFLAQALEHRIAGTLVDLREIQAVRMLDKVFGKKAKGGGDGGRTTLKENLGDGIDKTSSLGYNITPAKEKELAEIYERNVRNGWISPLSGFDNYKNLYGRVENEVVGLQTSNGIVIKSQSEHFLQRVIGTAINPAKVHNGIRTMTGTNPQGYRSLARSGVEIEDIIEAVTNGKPDVIRKNVNTGKNSQRFEGKNCIVSINPDTGNLIQCNPREKR